VNPDEQRSFGLGRQVKIELLLGVSILNIREVKESLGIPWQLFRPFGSSSLLGDRAAGQREDEREYGRDSGQQEGTEKEGFHG